MALLDVDASLTSGTRLWVAVQEVGIVFGKSRVLDSTICLTSHLGSNPKKRVNIRTNVPIVTATTNGAVTKNPDNSQKFKTVFNYLEKCQNSLTNVPLKTFCKDLSFSENKFNFKEWELLISDCPDKINVQKTLHGMVYGESVGYEGIRKRLICKNSPFSHEQKNIFLQDIKTRLNIKNDILGPFDSPPSPNFVCSRMHIVPKSNGKWRLVHDLSYPPRRSINDGIDKNKFPCKLSNVDTAISLIQKYLPGECVMMKFDFSGAYKQTNVCLRDLELGGFMFDNKFYIDSRLTFGAVSSASIFCRYSDLFKWILEHHYGFKGKIVSYMDDFCVICGKNEATELKLIFKKIAENLGILLETKKEEGPDFKVTFLGILLDSEKMQASIPPEKLQEILLFVQNFRQSKQKTIRELQKCIGKLQFVCKVVRAGRTFIGRLLEPLRGRRRFPSEKIILNDNQIKDLDWWIQFLPVYNGVSFFIEKKMRH